MQRLGRHGLGLGWRCCWPSSGPHLCGLCVGGELADKVRAWCAANGQDKKLRIVLCGHAGEHDALLANGWHLRAWTARKGYAVTDEAVENSASETLWCSPHCVPERAVQEALF
jgi:hypothetical protein